MMKKTSKNGNLEMYTSKSWIRNVTVQRTWRAGKHVRMIVFGFWFVVPPQLAIQVQQERIQVVRSNRVARKRPAKSNGTPAMDVELFLFCWYKTRKHGKLVDNFSHE